MASYSNFANCFEIADKFALVIDSALSGSTKCFPGQKVCEDSLLSEAVIRTALSYLVFLIFNNKFCC